MLVVRDFGDIAPSGTPWRFDLATWPVDWRERWGLRANALEDAGLPWRDAERQAFDELLQEQSDA